MFRNVWNVYHVAPCDTPHTHGSGSRIYLMSEPRIDPGCYRIRIRNANFSRRIFGELSFCRIHTVLKSRSCNSNILTQMSGILVTSVIACLYSLSSTVVCPWWTAPFRPFPYSHTSPFNFSKHVAPRVPVMSSTFSSKKCETRCKIQQRRVYSNLNWFATLCVSYELVFI